MEQTGKQTGKQPSPNVSFFLPYREPVGANLCCNLHGK
jgi:hypothetical protein